MKKAQKTKKVGHDGEEEDLRGEKLLLLKPGVRSLGMQHLAR